MTVKNIIFVIILGLALSACEAPEAYPETPEIEFKSLNILLKKKTANL